MLICTKEGRHFRAFINDQEHVNRVLEKAEDLSRHTGQVED